MLIKKPEVFHGNHKKRPYFEGWYHKMSLENGKSLVLIPGMYRSAQINYETAFLMIYNGIICLTTVKATELTLIN